MIPVKPVVYILPARVMREKIPVSGILSHRFGRRLVLVLATIAIGVFGLVMAPLLTSGLGGALAFSIMGLGLMGLTYGPIGAALAAPSRRRCAIPVPR